MADSHDSGANAGRPSSDEPGRTAPDNPVPHEPAVVDLAAKLSDLARTLQVEESVGATLQAIVDTAVDTVPGAGYAAISIVEHHREIYTRAGSAELTFEVDRVQYETGEGPCLSAVYDQQTVHLPDMTSEQRWPKFTRRAAELGVLSMLSLQLFVQKDTLGALNLYSTRRHGFNEESGHVGLLFAAHAAVAMSGAQQVEHLTRAMSARDVIGQAKGILMERHKLTADQAFSLLVRASQHTNTKLIEVAKYLTATGELTNRTTGDRSAA